MTARITMMKSTAGLILPPLEGSDGDGGDWIEESGKESFLKALS